MHVTGKILVFLTLGCAVAAFVVASRLVDVRGKWMKQLQDLKTQNDKTADQLVEARQKRDAAHENLEREMLRWNRYWPNVPGAFNPQGFVVNVGSANEIALNSTLYAFQLNADGSSTYVGPFTAAAVQANQSKLAPAFRVRPDDLPKWNGQNWRFRTTIPSASSTQISELETRLVSADESLANQEKNLEGQTESANNARQQRDERVVELLGGGQGSGPGLVADIKKADDERNASLAVVDGLRRSISAAEARVRELIKANNDLARTLPGQTQSKETALNPQSR